MKVYIGPYKNWFGPYQVAEKILFWKDKYDNDSVFRLGEWLAYGNIEERRQYNNETVVTTDSLFERMKNIEERPKSLLYRFLLWVDSKRSRKVKVRIDNYDTWSMDHTLSYIIVPMLKQLKETKHGAPCVDDKDVPKELRSTSAPPKKNDWDIDDNHFKRWDWVLDEMIWSFEQKLSDDEPDYSKTATPEEAAILHKKHYKRLNNGFKLFGKYYQNLWD